MSEKNIINPENLQGDIERKEGTKENWKETLKKFDGEEVFILFVRAHQDLIKSSIQESLPLLKEDDGDWTIEKYENQKTEFQDYPIVILDVEKGIHNYSKKTRYGGSVLLEIAKTDQGRSLLIEKQKFIGVSYGNFLATVEDKDKRKEWPGLKFDINLENIFNKKTITGEKLYNFIEQFIIISKECEIDLELKPLKTGIDGKLAIPDSIHTYPRIKSGLNQEQILEKLAQYYQSGKETWKDAFDINEENRTFKLAKKLFDKLKNNLESK